MFIIPKIEQLHSQDLTGASVLLNDVPEQSVSCNNWPVSFPETPQVSFRMASNGNDELFIPFYRSGRINIGQDYRRQWRSMD